MATDLTQLKVALTFFANALKTVTNANSILIRAKMNTIKPTDALGNLSKYYVKGSFDDTDLSNALADISVDLPASEDELLRFTFSNVTPAPFGGYNVTIGFEGTHSTGLTLKLSSVNGQTSDGPSQLSVLEVK